MGRYRKFLAAAFMIVLAGCATTERVAEVPSRPGITERVLVLAPCGATAPLAQAARLI